MDLNYYEDFTSDVENIFDTLNVLLSDMGTETTKKEVESIIDVLHMDLDNDYDEAMSRLNSAYDEEKRYQNKEYWNSQF